MTDFIHINPKDNVVVALHPISKGTVYEGDGYSVAAATDIPQGHKMTLKALSEGDQVIKYGFSIGHATSAASRIRPGTMRSTKVEQKVQSLLT